MFKRERHRAIAAILASLDAAFLTANRCYFGDGTAIALRHGEYRESVDIDFLVSDLAGYRTLRQAIKASDDLSRITKPGSPLAELREPRTGPYSIRSAIESQGKAIKLEIVFEGRIHFDTPADADDICGIKTLTALDLMTSKLLANCDRWRDDAVFSRNLIDIAMMDAPRLLPAALAKAETAYGDSVLRDVGMAANTLLAREGWMQRCMQAMNMDTPPAVLFKKIRALSAGIGKLGGESTAS